MPTPILIEQLHKKYSRNNKIALHEIDLQISEGEFIGLLGPNGSGKSTLINILSSTVRKTSGNVKIYGHDVSSFEARSMMGIVPQEIALDPFLTIDETLQIHCGLFGKKLETKLLVELLDILELSDKRKSRPPQLSGGMKHRLMVAMALIHRPRILILDEPTVGVDVYLKDKIWAYLEKIHREDGVTILLTTHDLHEAERLCNEIAILTFGNIVTKDTTKNIINRIDIRRVKITYDRISTDTKNILNLEFEKLEIVEFHIAEEYLDITYNPKILQFDRLYQILSRTNMSILDVITDEPSLEEAFKLIAM